MGVQISLEANQGSLTVTAHNQEEGWRGGEGVEWRGGGGWVEGATGGRRSVQIMTLGSCQGHVCHRRQLAHYEISG